MAATIPTGKVWAVLPAAGVGSRMGPAAGAHKALLQLSGRPLVYRSLERLFAAPAISGAVVAAHVDDLEAMHQTLEPLRRTGGRPIEVVAGGPSRQDSCFAGLKAVQAQLPAGAERAARVLFHDAARPLVTAAEVAALLTALETSPVALLATPVTQTIKRARTDGTVTETVPRAGLYQALTPQGFHFTAAWQAFERAEQSGFQGTDDVALAEFCGMAVKIVPGSPWNIKITTPEDLVLAQAILTLQERA